MLRHPGLADERQLFSALAVAGLIAALTGLYAALLFLLARHGLEPSSILAALCVSIVFAGAFAPFLLPVRLLAKTAGPAIGSMAALFVVMSPVCVYFLPAGFFLLYPVLALAGFSRAMRYVRLDQFELFVVLLLPPLMAAYFVATLQSLQGGVNLFGPEFAQLGWLTASAYYHAAIAQLIQHFGIVTTGLDGLGLPERYHFGSHFWFASLGRLGNSSPLLSYPLGYMVIVMPMLMFGVFAFVASRLAANKAIRFYCFVVLLWIAIDRLTLPSYYQSESYGIALVALVLSVPLMFLLVSPEQAVPVPAPALWLCAVLLLVPITLAKVSTGFLWAALLAVAALYRWRVSWRSAGMLVALAAVLSLLLSVSMQDWDNLLNALLGRSKNHLHAVPLQWFRYYRDHPFLTASVLATVVLALFCLRSSRRAKESGDGVCASGVSDFMVLGVITVVGAAATGIYLGGEEG